jgi:translation elongation factor EF-G
MTSDAEQGQEISRGANVITATVPLMNLLGYVNNSRAMSRGRATFTMQFDHYADVLLPPDDDPPFRPAIGMRGCQARMVKWRGG